MDKGAGDNYSALLSSCRGGDETMGDSEGK